MMTVQDSNLVTGQPKNLPAALGVWLVEGLEVDVYVRNEREAFGRRDYLVTPVCGGEKSKWVSASKVQLV